MEKYIYSKVGQSWSLFQIDNDDSCNDNKYSAQLSKIPSKVGLFTSAAYYQYHYRNLPRIFSKSHHHFKKCSVQIEA